MRARRDIIHSLTLCEIAHFHKQRREDFRDMMKAYLKAQIDFHEDVRERKREWETERGCVWKRKERETEKKEKKERELYAYMCLCFLRVGERERERERKLPQDESWMEMRRWEEETSM